MFWLRRKKAPTHREVFVSHCSDDNVIMDHLTCILEELFPSEKVKVFNSYSDKSGVDAGNQLSRGLRENLSESELMIAIITDAYERSLKCISEISSFWYSEKPIIPVIFNGNAGKKFIDQLFGVDVSAIIVGKDSSATCSEKLIKSIENNIFVLSDRNKALNDLIDFFDSAKQANTERPYIGSELTYDSVLKYCDKFGVKRISSETLSTKDIKTQLNDAEHIFIVSTTGGNLISNLKNQLDELVFSGTDITMILPNRLSDVCNDIALIEYLDNLERMEDNKKRIRDEFAKVMSLLCNCVDSAYKKSEGKPIGKVKVCCAFTLLRQTIILAVKNDGSYWGWMSVTLPPLRTNDGTPSLELCGKAGDHSLAEVVYEHVREMIKVAEIRDCCYEFQPNKKALTEFYLEKESAMDYWSKKQVDAQKEYAHRKLNYKNILIEIAAQHPLDGDKPDIEFQKRLDFGINLYNQLSSENKQAYIYVPGSVHCYDGVQDPVSLSCAGKSYLLEKGIPEEIIFGEDMNYKYKGNLGVYNSADECYVASEIYKNGRYADLYSICSPNQMLRKQLFYLAFEVIPQFYTVPCESLAHNLIYELFDSVPDVIYNDHTWQDKNSINANRTRKDRMPK